MENRLSGELLEVADVAKLANVTPAAVRRWVNLGQLRPVAVTLRGLRLFRRDDVEEVLARHTARLSLRSESDR